jgi:hypothetical protein
MVIVRDKKAYSEGGCNVLFGLGFLIVIHGKEKCKYFPIFLWTVVLAVFILEHTNAMVSGLLATLGFLSSLSQQLPCIETVLMENQFFQQQIILTWWLNYSAISRPKILVLQDSGYDGVL